MRERGGGGGGAKKQTKKNHTKKRCYALYSSAQWSPEQSFFWGGALLRPSPGRSGTVKGKPGPSSLSAFEWKRILARARARLGPEGQPLAGRRSFNIFKLSPLDVCSATYSSRR